jgi:predicted ATPase
MESARFQQTPPLMRNRLRKPTIRGFKTIRELVDFEPGALTVLIGPNGAGKSNFISFFRLLSFSLSNPGNLQEYVAKLGGASAILHDGPSVTREIEAEFTIVTNVGENQYEFRMAFAGGDTLIYVDERFRFSSSVYPGLAPWKEIEPGGRESGLINKANSGDLTADVIRKLLQKLIVHQFHNTSDTARIRTKWLQEDSRWLKEDAGNIAPVLFRLRETAGQYYQRIVDTIRLILPFFADFELEPDNGRLLLSWRERNSDLVFNASQAADGMLRAMALVTLLLQPERDLPDVLILDEPELGLHPYAISVIAGLIRSASINTQVIVATQSMPFIDCFEPEDIVVVERPKRESVFRRLSRSGLEEWLKDYSLSELWEKNVVGGRP